MRRIGKECSLKLTSGGSGWHATLACISRPERPTVTRANQSSRHANQSARPGVSLNVSTTISMTMNRREWVAASTALLAATCARPSESAISSKDTPAERLDVPSLLQLASVPGMAIATVRDGEVSVEGFGVRHAGTD